MATSTDFPDVTPEVVEAFTAATVTAFQELTATAVVIGEPADHAPAADTVHATIELRRSRPGRLVCTFPRAVLETFASRYLPASVALTSEIVDDSAGEFANVIAGQAKTMLKGTPYHYALSTPVVSRDAVMAATPQGEPKPLQLFFDSDAGGFGVQVELLAGG